MKKPKLDFRPLTESNLSLLCDAVESLLKHWETRTPCGPCHYGIGTLFMQVEYPFLRYNLFYYVYVLSFYEYARQDRRFLEALSALESKLDEDGRIVVERPHRGLTKLSFCKKGEPSELATRRYGEIKQNLAFQVKHNSTNAEVEDGREGKQTR